jgi:hypothetical protein
LYGSGGLSTLSNKKNFIHPVAKSNGSTLLFPGPARHDRFGASAKLKCGVKLFLLGGKTSGANAAHRYRQGCQGLPTKPPKYARCFTLKYPQPGICGKALKGVVRWQVRGSMVSI